MAKTKEKKICGAEDIFSKWIAKEISCEVMTEYLFHPTRKWRFDYAIPTHKIAVEIEGGIWKRGRHISPMGFLKDMEKYNTATSMGWRVLRTTPELQMRKMTLDMIVGAINLQDKVYEVSKGPAPAPEVERSTSEIIDEIIAKRKAKK